MLDLKGLTLNTRLLIRARDSLISFEELHDKLSDFEILKSNDTKLEQTPITAQFNQKSSYNDNRQLLSILVIIKRVK